MAANLSTARDGSILPSQYFETHRKQAPEQRLMIAVLRDAINCVEKYRFATDHRGRRLFDEARRWVLAGETDWLYSFARICDIRDLDPDAVRQRLRLVSQQSPAPASHGTVVSVPSDTSVGSAPGVRSGRSSEKFQSNP